MIYAALGDRGSYVSYTQAYYNEEVVVIIRALKFEQDCSDPYFISTLAEGSDGKKIYNN